MRTIAASALLFALAAPALADDARRYQAEIVRGAHRLDDHAKDLSKEVRRFVRKHPRYWLATVHQRDDTLQALFAVNRLVGSVQTFHDLVDDGAIESTYYSLRPAYEILLQDTRDVGRTLEHTARRTVSRKRYGRWVPDPFHRHVNERMLGSYRHVSDEVERLAFIRRIDSLPYVPPTPPLTISEIHCYKRHKYTYRMNLCIQGRHLDHSELSVRLVKRMDPSLDPWERGVRPDELQSSRSIGAGLEERCYYLRQIGHDIRVHQGDNVYVTLERPGRVDQVVTTCWDQNVVELSH